MNQSPSEKSGENENHEPENVDAAFSEIVAGFESSWVQSLTEDAVASEKKTAKEKPPTKPETASSAALEENWRANEQSWEKTIFEKDPGPDDEHYVPPEPPALPRPTFITIALVLLVLVGLILLIAPGLLGLSADLGLKLGITGIALGLILLIFRVKQSPSDNADPDTGAQV